MIEDRKKPPHFVFIETPMIVEERIDSEEIKNECIKIKEYKHSLPMNIRSFMEWVTGNEAIEKKVKIWNKIHEKNQNLQILNTNQNWPEIFKGCGEFWEDPEIWEAN